MTRSKRAPRRRYALGVVALSGCVLAAGCGGLTSGALANIRAANQAGTSSGALAGAAAAGAPAAGGAAGGSSGSAGGTTASTGGAASGATSGAPGGASTTTAGGVTVGATAAATGSGGSTTGRGTHRGTGGTGSSHTGACGVPTGGNTTGITPTSIGVGLHAPLTGTGLPFPNSSFVEGSKVFFEQPGIAVCGRKVVVDFQDDQYTPSGANQVCSLMAHRDFIVVGGAGTDQIQACATNHDIDSTGTPYLSAGVTTNGLTGLPNYFALSMTYEAQGPVVVRAAEANGYARPAASTGPNHGQWAVVTASTKNFADARAGIDNALSAAGISYDNFIEDQSGNYQAEAVQLGQQLALDGYKTIYTDAAPGFFVFMVKGYYGISPNGGGVTWTGPGVTFTDFEVAQLVCEDSTNQISGHAYYLAPNPGIDFATPAFKAAFHGSYDDIEWGLWDLDVAIYAMLQRASDNLTRQNFIATTLQSSYSVPPFAPITFNGSHFGGTGAWLQRINCGQTEPDQSRSGEWDTVGSTYLPAG